MKTCWTGCIPVYTFVNMCVTKLDHLANLTVANYIRILACLLVKITPFFPQYITTSSVCHSIFGEVSFPFC